MKSKAPHRQSGTDSQLKLTANLIQIGNSRGVRLPKAVIEQVGLVDKVEIIVRGNKVILQRAEKRKPREDWDEAFVKALAAMGPDALERQREEWADWQDAPNRFDEQE